MINKTAALFCTVFLFPVIACAETVYVTDLLRLNLYEAPRSQGKIIKTITSGDALQVLERQPNYAKIKTTDGTTGWTKSAYLVPDKPPRLIVSQIEQQLVSLKRQTANAIKEMKTAMENAEKYQQILHSSESNSKSQNAQLQKLRKQNNEYVKSMKTYGASIPLNVYLLSLLLMLTIGIASGWYYVDYRIRKRHGGFRPY